MNTWNREFVFSLHGLKEVGETVQTRRLDSVTFGNPPWLKDLKNKYVGPARTASWTALSHR